VTAAEPGPDGPRGPDGPDAAGAGPDSTDGSPGPLRVSTLELFFDLVFAFTLTQLAAVLADGLNAVAVVQVLLIFGLLWWMYEGYAWLTNTRPPVHATERLSLLAGMAGFLIVGLAIPRGFGGDGVTLGLGYLLVVVVHAFLYYRVNANIIRVAPFNICSALLIIVAGLAGGPARYPLWVAALVIQLGSPLIVHPRNLFELRPDHMAERHSALLIVALGESVAAIGIGAAVLGGTGGRLVLSAVLGLALAAALWWIIFGSDDEERTARALSAAPRGQRTALALSALFYGNVPVLLGLVAMATGVQEAIAGSAHPTAGHPRAAAVLAVGAALFLAGDAAIRRLLGTGSTALRLAGAAAALVTTAVGAVAGLDAQLAVLVAVLAAMLAAERRRDSGTAG
jgi:low temperature requirement protein LtrA